MVAIIRARNALLSLVCWCPFINAHYASRAYYASRTKHYPHKIPYCSLDDMTEILNHKFKAGDKAGCTINFDGPLNPLFGYLYRNSNLLANKRFFSYGIKLKSSCDCLKNNNLREDSTNNSLSEDDCVCISHQLYPSEYDTAFELYEGQKTKRSNLALDYLYDYHSCLIDMFKSSNRKKIFSSLKDSFSYFMETLPGETAERFLAVLFLLPENVYSVINSNVDCTGQNHLKNGMYYCGIENTADERVVFHSGAFEFELRCNTVEHGELIVRNSIKSIIGFFSDCGTKYKEVAEDKRKASREHGNDATYLMETPEFLIQNYIYEYCKDNRGRHVRIVDNIFRLLNEAGNDELFKKYFTQIWSEDKDAMKNRHHAEEMLSSYRNELYTFLGIYNTLPLDFMERIPEPKFCSMYNRSLDVAMGEECITRAETVVFSILCILFYDASEQCFKLPEGVKLRDERLQKLFSNQAVITGHQDSFSDRTTVNFGKPSGTYDCGMPGNKIELSAKDLNEIFGDLEDGHIAYKSTVTYSEIGKPDIKVRNALQSTILNIAYVVAYMTGNEDFMSRIRKAVEAMKRGIVISKSIYWKENKVMVKDLFLSLACRKGLEINVEFGDTCESRYNSGDVRRGCVSIKYKDFYDLVLKIDTDNEADAILDNRSHLNYSPMVKSLENLQANIRGAKDRSVILDLLHKTIEYDLKARFQGEKEAVALTLRDKIRGILDGDPKMKSMDHWLVVFDLFKNYSDASLKYGAIFTIFDEMRHLASDRTLDRIELRKMRNAQINIVLYGLDQLKWHNAAHIRNFASFIFLMIYDISAEETAVLGKCKNTKRAEDDLRRLSGDIEYIHAYSNPLCFSYYLNWHLAEKCFGRDRTFFQLYRAIMENLRIGYGADCACGGAMGPYSKWFFMDLYSKMKNSDDRRHIDRFVKGFPDDLNAVAFLFCECLTARGYLNTKVYEVASKFLGISNACGMSNSMAPLTPIKIKRQCTNAKIYTSTSIWKRLLSLTIEGSRDINIESSRGMNQAWEVCDYILKNNNIRDRSRLEMLKNKYEALKASVNRIMP